MRIGNLLKEMSYLLTLIMSFLNAKNQNIMKNLNNSNNSYYYLRPQIGKQVNDLISLSIPVSTVVKEVLLIISRSLLKILLISRSLLRRTLSMKSHKINLT